MVAWPRRQMNWMPEVLCLSQDAEQLHPVGRTSNGGSYLATAGR